MMASLEQPIAEEERNLSVAVPSLAKPEDMDKDSTASHSQPSWFSPKALLLIFCSINLINYVDRGVIASNGVNSGITTDFKMSNFEDGIISSAFMVGLLLASPIFASLAKSVNPFRLIGAGLSAWCFAAAGCGLSFNFFSITFCRMVVGIGEASFISLAAPFIDDNAPPGKKSAWLATFYMCIPAGVALGYVYGGLVGSHIGWRYAFFGEAIFMLPFAVLGFVMKPLHLKGFASSGPTKEASKVKDGGDIDVGQMPMNDNFVNKRPKKALDQDQFSRFLKDVKVLLLERVYVVNVLGYIAYNFVIGAYSYWGPKAGFMIYHMTDADLVFGGITVVCGILGTVAGGYILDCMTCNIPNAFKLLSTATFFGAIFCFSAFCFKNMYVFLVLFAIGEMLLFAVQGPVNYISLHCVKPSMRPIALAMSTVSIHIFGDVPSSPLVGVLQDSINNWRISALILTSIFFVASAVWFTGIFLEAKDRFSEDSENPIMITDKSATTTPLLGEETTMTERDEST